MFQLVLAKDGGDTLAYQIILKNRALIVARRCITGDVVLVEHITDRH